MIPNYNILIIDDDSDDHLLLKIALSEVVPQAEVKSLYDGQAAIEYLNRCKSLPNVVFLDLNMNKDSGKVVTSRIRSNEKFRGVPVIILTTSEAQGEKKELIELGASDFYTKPRSISDLVKIVENVKTTWLNSRR